MISYLVIYCTITEFSYQFVNNFFALLLCKINDADVFNMVDMLQNIVKSRSTEIVIQWNFWLAMYVPTSINPSLNTSLKVQTSYYWRKAIMP